MSHFHLDKEAMEYGENKKENQKIKNHKPSTICLQRQNLNQYSDITYVQCSIYVDLYVLCLCIHVYVTWWWSAEYRTQKATV